MKVHVLTYGRPSSSGTASKKDLELLTSAAQRLGHELEIIYARDCQLRFDKSAEILVRGKKLDINVLLVRANFLREHVEFRSGLIRQFEYGGMPVINRRLPVLRAKNKLRTMQVMSRSGVPIPKSYFIRSAEYLDEVINDIGSFPVILKTIAGSHGSGVSIIESKRGLKSILEMVIDNEISGPLTVQEYIKESKGKDIRVFIVGRRIVGAMERIATKKGEFRSNFHLGGRVRVAEMSQEEKDASFAAIKACGLEIAGVDLLRTRKGPKVLEVNANPGLEGITKATGRDIAGEMIKYAVNKGENYLKKKKAAK